MGIQLNIKSEEARRLALLLAKESGESLTRAVIIALRVRLELLQKEKAHAPDALRERERKFYEIVEGSRQRWRDDTTLKDVMDSIYDKYGLPR